MAEFFIDRSISETEIMGQKPNYAELRTAYTNYVAGYLCDLEKDFSIQSDSQSSVTTSMNLPELLDKIKKDKTLSNTPLPELIVGFRKMADAHLQMLDKIHAQATTTINADITRTEDILAHSMSRVTEPLNMAITLLNGNVERFQQEGFINSDAAGDMINSKTRENKHYLAAGIEGMAKEIKELSVPMKDIDTVTISDKKPQEISSLPFSSSS